jgi:TolB-like protein/DNA-binding winged helix-turn-helix (wHTH) protein
VVESGEVGNAPSLTTEALETVLNSGASGVLASVGTARPSELGAIRFGVFEVDLHAGELRKQGVRIKLQEQPFQVLQVLLEKPGEVVTREDLRQRIWPADTFVDFDGGVNNAIKRLREALGDRAETPRYIETLPRRGYRFIGTVNGSAQAAPASGSPPLVEPHAEPAASRRTLRAGILIGLGLAALLLAVLGFTPNQWWNHLRGRSAVPEIRSIAVLPLQNLSGDPTQEYFADAMTEELITDLSQISALKVISHTSVDTYKKSSKSLPEIARELHVDGVVAGSVMRSGDKIRITAQLIYAPEDKNLWAERYDRDLSDALTLQRTIAAAIGDEIRIKITPETKVRLGSKQPVNPKALDAYLTGRYHFEKQAQTEFIKGMQGVAEEEYSESIRSFRKAIEEDPNYAQGYVGLANALLSARQSDQDVGEARAAVKKALELDDRLEDAHLTLATMCLDNDWDWAGAEREFQQIVQLNPSSARGHDQYGYYLDGMGRFTEGLEQHQRAQELDPGNDHLSGELYFRQQWNLDRNLAVDLAGPNGSLNGYNNGDWYRAVEYERLGMQREAIVEWERVGNEYGYPDVAQAAAKGFAKAGYKGALRAITQGMEGYLRRGKYVSKEFLAHFYGELGDKDRAFYWLEKSYHDREYSFQFLKVDPLWGENLRSDPRFQDLVRRVGLPP